MGGLSDFPPTAIQRALDGRAVDPSDLDICQNLLGLRKPLNDPVRSSNDVESHRRVMDGVSIQVLLCDLNAVNGQYGA